MKIASRQEGFSLIEALVAVALSGGVLLTAAQLIGTGIELNHASAGLGSAASLASDQVERLRNLPYDQLIVGGSLDNAVNGYRDEPSSDSPETSYERRWRVTQLSGMKRIDVRVVTNSTGLGPSRSLTVSTLIADRSSP